MCVRLKIVQRAAEKAEALAAETQKQLTKEQVCVCVCALFPFSQFILCSIVVKYVLLSRADQMYCLISV